MSDTTVSAKDWPAQENWPKAGWKHALNYQRFSAGHIFGWYEDGYFWTGIVEERKTCSVKVKDVLPGVMKY
jgi:hypothetical protein